MDRASDYESGGRRFEPCGGRLFFLRSERKLSSESSRRPLRRRSHRSSSLASFLSLSSCLEPFCHHARNRFLKKSARKVRKNEKALDSRKKPSSFFLQRRRRFYPVEVFLTRRRNKERSKSLRLSLSLVRSKRKPLRSLAQAGASPA